MNAAAKIILDPPTADVVLVFSASWFVWTFIGLCLVAIIAAFARKSSPPKE